MKRTALKFAGLLAGTTMMLAGCATHGDGIAEPPTDAIEASFMCGAGTRLDVAFSGDKAVVKRGTESHVLTQQPSGSGYAYAGGGYILRGKGRDTTWTAPDGDELSCTEIDPANPPGIQPPVSPPVTRGLPGTRWRLVHFQSSDDSIGTRIPPNPEKYLLHFASDGSLSAQLDCNRLAGKWAATPGSPTGGGLEIQGGGVTRAMCQPGAMDTQIARDMGFVRSYTIRGTRLSLALMADAGIYDWEAVAPE
jgi:heat shock protein HslJ/membrane-bound inhibitor of C-type lysozyme